MWTLSRIARESIPSIVVSLACIYAIHIRSRTRIRCAHFILFFLPFYWRQHNFYLFVCNNSSLLGWLNGLTQIQNADKTYWNRTERCKYIQSCRSFVYNIEHKDFQRWLIMFNPNRNCIHYAQIFLFASHQFDVISPYKQIIVVQKMQLNLFAVWCNKLLKLWKYVAICCHLVKDRANCRPKCSFFAKIRDLDGAIDGFLIENLTTLPSMPQCDAKDIKWCASLSI